MVPCWSVGVAVANDLRRLVAKCGRFVVEFVRGVAHFLRSVPLISASVDQSQSSF